MDSPSSHIDSGEIATDVMCLIKRKESGELFVCYERIPYNSQIVDKFKEMSATIHGWDHRRAKELFDELVATENPDFAQPFYRDADNTYMQRVLRTYDNLLAATCGQQHPRVLVPVSPHAQWLSPNTVSYLADRENAIRQAPLQEESLERGSKLPSDFNRKNAASLLNKLDTMRGKLVACLDDYDKRFAEFVQTARSLVPGLFSKKSYCRCFNGAYGSSELDYVITPGNQCLIDNLPEYYQASILEDLYARYDADPQVVAYSSRKLGWDNFQINLDASGDLKIELKTNFGFGRSSYFLSILCYKGINAVNAPLIIFYNIAHLFELAGFTDMYELAPASYKLCFENAVEYWQEFNAIGEVAFIEKYFARALIELKDLLRMVSCASTFLQFTDLNCFNDLVSQDSLSLVLYDEWNPSDVYRCPSAVDLSNEDKQQILNFVMSVSRDQDNQRLNYSLELQSKIQSTFSLNSENNNSVDFVRVGLARQKLLTELYKRFGQAEGIDALADETIPYPGYFIRTYKNFDLIQFRIKKARVALNLFNELKSIAAFTKLQSVIVSLLEICQDIRRQAEEHIVTSLDPVLSKYQQEKKRLESQLEEIRSKMKSPVIESGEHNWVREQERFISDDIFRISNELQKLENNKRELGAYVAKCNSISKQA